MTYREVGMVEVKEVLLLWLAGRSKKAIARQVGLDPKTVRSYVAAAEAAGLTRARQRVAAHFRACWTSEALPLWP
jgi:DNA-binding NarL/FixJ family response regulator